MVRRPGRKLVGRVGVSHRCALVPAGDHGVVETVHLESAVVAAAVVAGRRYEAERALIEPHHDGGRVDVAVFGEPGVALHAARRVYLDSLLAGDPAQHIEIVYRAVAEDATRTRDVFHRWGSGIHRRAAHGVQQTQ